MDLHVYLSFVAATAVMIALPGPSVLLTVAHSISFGWRRALATVAGETMGIAVQLIVAAVGLTSLLNVVAEAFELIRWAGSAYLVYLGIRQWRSAGEFIEIDTSSISRTNLFVQGLVITIPNPKSLMFIAAFLPQFINTAYPMGVQFAIILPTFLVITFMITSVWALGAGNVRGGLKGRHAFQSVLRASGGLMIIAGIGLGLARRGN